MINCNPKLQSLTTDWLGVKFKHGGRDRYGIDCLGWMLVVYREVLRVDLPDPINEQTDHFQTLAVLSERFDALPSGSTPDQLQALDVVLYRWGTHRDPHLAIVEDDRWCCTADMFLGVTRSDLLEEMRRTPTIYRLRS